MPKRRNPPNMLPGGLGWRSDSPTSSDASYDEWGQPRWGGVGQGAPLDENGRYIYSQIGMPVCATPHASPRAPGLEVNELNSPQHRDGAIPALSSPSANVGPQLETDAQRTPRQDRDHADSEVNELDTPDHHDGAIRVPTPSSPSANVGSQPASGTDAQHTPRQDNADGPGALVMASECACTINQTDLKGRLGNFFNDSLPQVLALRTFLVCYADYRDCHRRLRLRSASDGPCTIVHPVQEQCARIHCLPSPSDVACKLLMFVVDLVCRV
ncbi:hypothetical protein JVU11DRAFT_12041 [Chiua virens]|nr:hypothetical protein JVU11DRAFT_12041 [Chiua virens]